MRTPLETHSASRRSSSRAAFVHGLRLVVGTLLFACSALTARADVYVADNALGELLDYTAANTLTALDRNLYLPNGVALDAAGNIYVSDNGSGTIYKYTPGGSRSNFVSNVGNVNGMVFDGAGNFYASLYDKATSVGSIIKITPAGVMSTFATGLTRPRGLAFDSAGNLYQADLDSGYIYKYTTAGDRSTFAGVFNYPTGVAFDAGGNLYVCSQGVGVFKITPTGFVSTFTTQVTDPRDLAFDAAGNLYVTDVGDASGDSGQGSIYVFTPAGGRSTFASNLAGPLGIAIGPVNPHPGFFTGETALGNGVYYLSFPSSNYFGYYSFLSDPHYLFHFDLGYEYVFDAADGKSGVYLYDFASSGFFYTSPTFPYPYLYDFSLNSVVYYYPDPNNAGHYNTNGVRYFYVFSTGQIISK